MKESNVKVKRLKYKISNDTENNNAYGINNKLVSLSRSNTYQNEDPIPNKIKNINQRPRIQYINAKKCYNSIHNFKEGNATILSKQSLERKKNFYNMNDSGISNNDNINNTINYNSNNSDDHNSNEDYNKNRNSDNCFIY